jgi:hypothetical protein
MIFPTSLPATFGYLPSRTTIDGTSLELNAGVVATGLSRVHAQMVGKPRFTRWLTALLTQVQHAEIGAWQLLAERSLDRASGASLKRLARIVGLDGATVPADELPMRIAVEGLILRSTGTPTDLLRVADVFTGGVGVRYSAAGQATAMVTLLGGTLSSAAYVLASLLGRAKPAGVRLSLVHRAQNAAFRFSSSSASENTSVGLGDSAGAVPGGALAGAVEVL